MDNLLKQWLKKFRLNESILSMALGALVVVVVGILIFNYFAKTDAGVEVEPISSDVAEIVPVEMEGETPAGLPRKHVVATGEHLWSIAEKYFGSGYNWIDIAQTNKLQKPNLLIIDQELTITQVTARKITIQPMPRPGKTYSVQLGDSLWSLAVKAYGDGFKWLEIAQANNLSQPDLIEVGQEIKIP